MVQGTSYGPGTPCWIDVSSPDVDASIAFYEDLFGWETSEAGDPEETGGYRMFNHGEKAIAGVMATQADEEPPAWTTYITVEDADATVENVKAAGGSLMMGPMEATTAGRMAFLADPDGAMFAIWQPRDHIGSQLVNEPVSLCWNELRTRDTESAKKFYGEVFGWEPTGSEQMPDYTIWTLGGDGPEEGKGGMMDMAAADMPAEAPPHWDVAFAVVDSDQVAAKCSELGGTVTVPPMDIPVGRMACLQDPAGAGFTVIKLTPPE